MVRKDDDVQDLLNDNSAATPMLAKVKNQVIELFHSKIPILDKYREMFPNEIIRRKLKIEAMQSIGVPYKKLLRIYELIKFITEDISNNLELHRTQSYLCTGDAFEQIFNDDIEDPEDFVLKIEAFQN